MGTIVLVFAANEGGIMTTRPPLPPFTRETAILKVCLAEDGWNSRDPEKVSSRLLARFALEKPLGICGNCYRSYGNENWEFNDDGLMCFRFACINDLPIKESDRKYHWPLGRRPDDHPGLSDLGF